MTNYTINKLKFSTCKGRKIITNFNGGKVTSDGGVLLLRDIDKKLNLIPRIACICSDIRKKSNCKHDIVSMIRQRVYSLALGYEDLNDHNELRNDPAFQTAINKDEPLASPSTLCRFENLADRNLAWNINNALVETFIESFKKPPKKIILDFDPTDDPIHGKQEGSHYNGYYKCYCYLPLYVMCGSQLLVAYLRPSNIDGAKHVWAILSLLVKRIRQKWPRVKIIFRGDSGLCRHKMLDWCDRKNVKYIVGIGNNSRLLCFADEIMKKAKNIFQKTEKKQRLFDEFNYAAKSWSKKRRIIVKAEYNKKGSNTRFVVTNMLGRPKKLYDKVYCMRGDMENRIKEQQLDLFADRTSSHKWYSNQLRLLLSSLAYTLIDSIRRIGLYNTELAKAQAGTIRLKLLKIGAVIVKKTRTIYFHMSSAYPFKQLFYRVAHQLC